MSSNEQYDKLWNFLAQTLPFGRPLHDPGISELSVVAPHLERHELQDLLDRHRTERVAFLGPGLVIRGAVHHYFLMSAAGQSVVYRSHTMRVRASYACSREPSQLLEPALPFLERAIDYAEINWGDKLVWDRGIDAVHGTVCAAPGSKWGDIEFVSLCDVSLARLIAEAAIEEPISEMLDDAIIETYEPRFAAEEALGQRTPYKVNFCGRCGGGLAHTRCSFCGLTYDFGGLVVSDWPHPICLSMLAAVQEKGYEFEIDPVEARKAEHRKWAKSDFVLTKPEAEQPLRSIVLGDSVEH